MGNCVLRAVQKSDLTDILDLIQSNAGGMTSLLGSESWLTKEIEKSIISFDKNLKQPENEKYLFVLEDLELKKVIGVSAIASKIGYPQPFYTYKLDKESVANEDLNLRYERALLTLVNDYSNCSEICSLYLNNNYRKRGLGIYLSRVRFLFILLFQDRFANKVIANMRGVIDKDGISPFWQAVGHKFFQIDYHDAIQKTSMTNYRFIVDLFPKKSIYLNYLPQKAIKVIGRSHVHTKTALKILLSEGFVYNNHVDVFDAGPILEVNVDSINTCQKAKRCFVIDAKDKLSSKRKCMISSVSLDFCATINRVRFVDERRVILPTSVVNQLNLEIGDEVLIV